MFLNDIFFVFQKLKRRMFRSILFYFLFFLGYERLVLARFTIYLIFQVDLGCYCERYALARDSRFLVFQQQFNI